MKRIGRLVIDVELESDEVAAITGAIEDGTMFSADQATPVRIDILDPQRGDAVTCPECGGDDVQSVRDGIAICSDGRCNAIFDGTQDQIVDLVSAAPD